MLPSDRLDGRNRLRQMVRIYWREFLQRRDDVRSKELGFPVGGASMDNPMTDSMDFVIVVPQPFQRGIQRGNMIRKVYFAIEQRFTLRIGRSNPSTRDADATNFDRNLKAFDLVDFIHCNLQAG